MNTSIDVFHRMFLGALIACVILADAHAQSAPAPRDGSDPIVFETRPPGQAGGGLAISEANFHGHTFRLHERTEITALGLGNLSGSAGTSVFAALYRIDTPDTVPDAVNDSDLLGATVLEVPSSTTDVTGEISLVVEPGIYAILAGTGRHGASLGGFHAGMENTGTGSTPDTWNLPFTVHSATGARILQSASPRFFIEGGGLPPSDPSPTEFLMETARPTAWWTQSSISISNNFWFGTRFEISRPTRIDQVGSWLRSGSGQLFAAIIELSGPGVNPLPVSHPGFMSTVAGTALIDVGGAPRAYTGQFEDVELTAGNYALVLGTGMFGASGSAGIMGVADEIVIPDTLVWAGSFWSEFPESHRFFLTGLIPELSVTPAPADFGSVPIGEAGVETVTITNLRDDADLQVSGIGVGASPRFSLGPDVGGCSVTTLGPGDSCQFTVLFHPSQAGPESGILQVWSDGEPSPFVIDLTGDGIAPTIDLDTGVFEFEIHQGDADTATLSVGNTGEADLNWNVMISEAPLTAGTRGFQEIHEGFENVSQLPAAGWVRINNSEPPGTPGWFQGGSYPAHQGPTNSYISAAWHNTEGPNGVISNWLLTPELDLSEGVQLRFWTRVPTNSCCPDRLEVWLSTAGDSTDVGDSEFSTGDFATRLLTVNEALVQGGYPQEWTEFIVTVPAQGASTGGRLAFRYFVTEAGSQSPNSNWLSIDTVSITQWDGGPVCTGPAEIPWLRASPDNGTTPPDGSSEVDVGIDTAGLAEGEYSAQLCVSSNDPDNPLVAVPLGLTVMPPRTPELVFDPPALDFADVNLGTTGGPLTATLSNAGNADAAGLNFTLGGNFDLQYNDCGNALPAGGNCQVGIVFTPAEEGPAAGALDVTATGGFSAALTLSGNGVDAPAPVLEYGPESFAFELFPEEIDTRELLIGNLGAGDLTWSLDTDIVAASGARGHDPALDEPIAIPDFEIDSAANGGQPVTFILPGDALTRGEVVGFSFTGTVSGISGTASVARETCMFVTAPDGTSYAFGGYFAVPGCGLQDWDFHGPEDGTYESHHDNVFQPPVADSGGWTFTFHNAWNNTAAATMAWSDVTVTLHKIPAPCLAPSEVDWLSADPESGIVAPGNSEAVGITVDTSGLTEGNYAASLCISSNDPAAPLAAVPVTLRVEAPAPAMVVAPASVEFEVLQGNSAEDSLTVSNPGLATLEWSLFEPLSGNGSELILLEEDFEGGFLPSGWNATDTGNLSCPWLTSDDYGLDGWNGTGRGAAVDSDACFPGDVPFNSVNASLISPALDLTHVENARLTFDLAYRHLGLSRLRLEVSTNGGANWTTLRTWSSNYAFPNNPSLPVSTDLSQYDGEAHVLLRWRYSSGWDWWAFIDNVMVTADPPATCHDPLADPWLAAGPSSGTVAPGGSQQVELSVDSSDLPTGAYSADLCFLSNVPGRPLAAVPVTLSVTAPELTLDPVLIDFGEVMIGGAGDAETVTLHNTGNADATGLAFGPPGAPFDIDTTDCGTTLPAGGSCTLAATFFPVEPGPADGLLEISSNEGAVTELQLAGTGTVPVLTLTPAALVFGDVPVGETGAPATLTLASSGTAAVTIDNISVPDAPFAPAGGTCAALPFTLQPGESCELDFAFAPTKIGGAAATLAITGNAPSSPDEIHLSGTGIAAVLQLDPASLALQLVTGQSDTRTLFIANAGNIDLDWSIAVEAGCGAGGAAGWLDADPAAGITPPADTTPVSVTIDAAGLAAGVYEAVLCVTGNALGSPQTAVPVTLTVTAPGLAFDPPALDFGDVKIDTGGLTLTAALHNHGDSAATELDFLIPDGFSAGTTGCGGSLAAGDSCEITVTFAPVQTGAVDGLLIAGSAEGAVTELELTGNGTETGALGVDPGQLHFADVVVTTSHSLAFNVTNTADPGANDLEVSAISLESGAPAFAISGIDCVAGTVLPPGESCIVEITFSPSAVAAHQGTIRIAASDGQQITLALSGTVLGDTVFSDRFEQP